MNINPSILAATAVGLTLVGTAFVFSINRESVSINSEITAAKQPVRTFIPVYDSNSDGVPDWQDSLNIPTIYLDADNSTAATMTKTAALAVELATRSVAGSETGASSVNEINSKLISETLDKQYKREDIKVSINNDTSALRNYGNRVAAITFQYAPAKGTENELTLLNRSFTRNDPSVLDGLEPTIKSYEQMLQAMLETEVPSSLVREHLSLINVYGAIANDIKAFKGVYSDALPAMTRLRRYQADAEALYLAISNLYLKLDQNGIKWGEGDTAAKFIKIQ